jgi:hypothetical protein
MLDTAMAVTITVFTKAGAVVATRTNTTNSSSIRINSTVLVTCPALPSWADVSSTLAIFFRRQDGRNSRISSLGVVLWIGQRLQRVLMAKKEEADDNGNDDEVVVNAGVG